MTNDLMNVISRPPIEPDTVVLWCSWLLSLVTAIITTPLGVYRLCRGKSVVSLASASILVAILSGVGCLSSLLWGTGRTLQLLATCRPAVDSAMVAMAKICWVQTFELSAVSVAICGINAVIGAALILKWKEPQHAVAD
jgi:hypothetical protein